MNCKRKYYEKRFSKYPDVVDLFTFRKMLGGIGDTFARRLVRENKVKHTFVKPHYWIYKQSIIDCGGKPNESRPLEWVADHAGRDY